MIGIVAMSEDRVIGRNGTLPWHLSEDLKFFKRTTVGHVVLMGRKTYESIGKPLPNRENWVLTRGAEIEGVRTLHEASAIAEPGEGRKLFLIGGAELFATLLPRCEEIYLTRVKRTVPDGDTFMPAFEDRFSFAEVLLENDEMAVQRWVANPT